MEESRKEKGQSKKKDRSGRGSKSLALHHSQIGPGISSLPLTTSSSISGHRRGQASAAARQSAIAAIHHHHSITTTHQHHLAPTIRHDGEGVFPSARPPLLDGALHQTGRRGSLNPRATPLTPLTGDPLLLSKPLLLLLLSTSYGCSLLSPRHCCCSSA